MTPVTEIIERLIEAAKHGEHPEGDPAVVAEAEGLLSKMRSASEVALAKVIDAHPINLAEVSTEMLYLERLVAQDARPEVGVGEVAAQHLGVPHTEEFDSALEREARRTVLLLEGHYARYGIKESLGNVVGLGFTQGITFAVAVGRVKAR